MKKNAHTRNIFPSTNVLVTCSHFSRSHFIFFVLISQFPSQHSDRAPCTIILESASTACILRIYRLARRTTTIEYWYWSPHDDMISTYCIQHKYWGATTIRIYDGSTSINHIVLITDWSHKWLYRRMIPAKILMMFNINLSTAAVPGCKKADTHLTFTICYTY